MNLPLMEIGFAHVLRKKIFLMNPIPDIEYYRSEIEAVQPAIIKQNLNNIPQNESRKMIKRCQQ